MDLTAAGLLVLITQLLFAWCLPRHGIGTEFEPYVPVGIVAGVALGACMVLVLSG